MYRDWSLGKSGFAKESEVTTGKEGLYGLYGDCGDEEKPVLWKETRSRQGKGVYEWVCRVFDGRNVKKWGYGGCIHGEIVEIH